MAEVRANARARVFNYDESDDVMTPLPPPPRPQARPSVRGVPMATAARAAAHSQRANQSNLLADHDDEFVGAPLPLPVPHAHPLAALNGNCGDARNQRHIAGHKPRGKRLNPAFFSRERIAAFSDKENVQAIESEAKERRDDRDANTTDEKEAQRAVDDRERQNAPSPSSFMDSRRLHSTRILQRRMQDVENERTQIPDLLEEERVFAATDASHWRHELHPLPITTAIDAMASGANGTTQEDTALERARLRRVKKQVDPKWLQTQSDASNRPRAPLERDDELHLREVLLRTTASELLTSGVLFDDDDAKRMASFSPSKKASLPIYSSGTTGLPGCCYDSWSY